jgi:hypothetical protein
MNKITSLFNSLQNVDMFQRIDETHVLDLYFGFDSLRRPTLLLVTKTEPLSLNSSKFIVVETGRRIDTKWAVSLTLLQANYEDMFNSFCQDLIESSRLSCDEKAGTIYFCNRFIKWQTMLLKTNGNLLSISEIKGLIGELVFLKRYLFKAIGYERALDSWIGPERADQDFVTEDTWWEVKATNSGSEKITISSIEQLDTINQGSLVIVYLDKTSKEDNAGITLNAIIAEINQIIETEFLREKLNNILLLHDYYNHQEYDEFAFKFHYYSIYRVDQSFPSIRRKDVPIPVISAKYEFSINSIQGYLIDERAV